MLHVKTNELEDTEPYREKSMNPIFYNFEVRFEIKIQSDVDVLLFNINLKQRS